jgi:N-acetylneuraminate synthase
VILSRIFLIAEAGVNHNGSLEQAKELVKVAKEIGADAVKFQTFRADKLVSVSAEKAHYQKVTTGSDGSQLEMIRSLELSSTQFQELANYAERLSIEFMSTPFDEESVELVVSLGVKRLKIGSGDLTSGPLLLAMSRSCLPIILSTGMGTLHEIREALAVLAFGYTQKDTPPSPSSFEMAFQSEVGKDALARSVTLLHCTTEYPCPPNEIDLRVMDTLRNHFGLSVGFSDHSEGISASLAAAALGASVIEKHITLSRSLPGPDHRASLEPNEFALLVKGVREIEQALGHPEKTPRPSEKKNIAIARKSLVASSAIAKGERFTLENLTTKRPGSGISSMRYWELLGKEAARSYAKDELIEDSELLSKTSE